ncbi:MULTISPECIES: MocR-like pyridoxine biosynthesis transcription factor PdxR [Paraburkholderia]|uniref:MocR-like pyridoxine biosynthesis transcription factor PdxR n=1 Tax=Paraburkholderia TaxID=1822464 RepID=UPI00225867DB|nr:MULTISPECIES: PLP-dependent aminotransferase family protein [Paraburkholderia]MCX4155041.1 PLP-dependent aminotransferase family protein [Paraburkholderia aspalathi]MDN7164451.1 PLP-dependent aminotransferase family protein [Paraburkholderia sp. SECH2]MDQ6392936.1 PLP-dependent aminotransferase family protein [Paraburkholderia aspalathi]
MDIQSCLVEIGVTNFQLMSDLCDVPTGTAKRERSTVVWSLPLGKPDANDGLQRWLYKALRQAIISGRLPEGSVLPGSRTLARQYGLARGTVAAAYEQLLAEGYLDARAGSGTRVSAVLPDQRQQVKSASLSQAAAHGHLARESRGPWITRLKECEPPFPLSGTNSLPQPFLPHRGDLRLFPVDLWRQLHVRALRPSRLLTLNDTRPGGLPELRSAIAKHLAITRSVMVSPAQIAIVGSVQQALDLCMRLLSAPGDSVWMEDPGYIGARQIMLASGANVVDVPVDHDGLRVQDGIREAPTAVLAYVTPSRQAPLGVPLSAERRASLLRWATANDAIIFEDDYDSEYCFRTGPPGALRSLPGADSHVVMVGTFSKLMFPSLRLAFVVLPPRLVEPFIRAASLTTRSANGLTQAVLADFLREGHFDQHIRRTRKIYSARARAFERSALEHWQGLLEVPPICAGLDVVGRLLQLDEYTAVRKLKSAGVEAAPLGRYTQRHSQGPGLVMGFASFNEEEIDQAAQRVAAALCEPV